MQKKKPHSPLLCSILTYFISCLFIYLKKITTGSKGGKDTKAAPPTKKASIKAAPPVEEPPPVEVTEPEPEPKPELTKLPDLKLAHFYDPDTGDEVMTREDLVVVINSTSNQSTLVQHADGTHIYSEIREIYHPEHEKTSGELMMDQITEVYPSGEKKEPEGGGSKGGQEEDAKNIGTGRV